MPMQMLDMIIKRFEREYGLILAFIAIVCVIALTALGVAVSGLLGSVSGAL